MKRGLPKDLIRYNDTDRTIAIIPTEAIISFKSEEKPDYLFGEYAWAAVMEEASRMREEATRFARRLPRPAATSASSGTRKAAKS